jgi:formate dehydrogenase subunit gamma
MTSTTLSKEQEEVEVASVGYRVAHAVNLGLITFLAITGLMLLFPNLMDWLTYAVGVPIASYLGTPSPISAGAAFAMSAHVFVGELWGLFLIVYVIYLLAFRRIRVFDALRKPLSQQWREAKALFHHYTLGRPIPKDVAESLDRHNVLVAYTVIILVVGIILLSISGVLMAYRYILNLGPGEFGLLLLLHDVGFYLVLIFIYLHLFASLHSTNRPLLLAMFGVGKVPLRWAEENMPRYLRRFLKRE